MRITYVEGVSPAKWLRIWADRRPDRPLETDRVLESEQLDSLASGSADMAFVRLPIDETGLHVIALWEEIAVAALPRDHAYGDAEAIELADLEGETTAPLQATTELTLELVAAGTGYAIVPHSLARLYARRDVKAVPVTDAPTTRIALVWPLDRDDDDTQEFVGVVRGRTAKSSRGADAPDEPAPVKKPARPTTPKKPAQRVFRSSRARRPPPRKGRR